ncbi:MAG: tRNA 2-thiouridine(34) synthase MnmA [Actinobacteria bacterium HGW-Actinobacteria-10]|nr:MAG: tRNA 2-thiouridine(34) synthase MnmA [Actinobacteria bacterium HGW-Actinobacteria-10]
MPEVAIALSGGVDSSVAAALLVEQGRDVFGVTMRLGLAEIAGRPCCGEEEVALARRVCAHLGIPHVVIDMAGAFHAEVVEPFVEAYAAGLTPNPCVRCNERIKLGAFAQRVRALGATALATGHYARLERDTDGVWLTRAADRTKDQSYFLYRVAPATLDLLEFPLGELPKAEVRRMAAERGLPTAKRRESQEVCFTSDHVALVAASHPGAAEPGPLETADGTVLGTHRGIARYTVGQRKGLGVGGPGGPYRVVRIDAGRRAVIVAPEAEALTERVTLADPLWRLGAEPAHLLAQIRYRSAPRPAMVTPAPDGLEVEFDTPADPLAPGQSVVLYDADRVVGGGIVGRHL